MVVTSNPYFLYPLEPKPFSLLPSISLISISHFSAWPSFYLSLLLSPTTSVSPILSLWCFPPVKRLPSTTPQADSITSNGLVVLTRGHQQRGQSGVTHPASRGLHPVSGVPARLKTHRICRHPTAAAVVRHSVWPHAAQWPCCRDFRRSSCPLPPMLPAGVRGCFSLHLSFSLSLCPSVQ